MKYCFSFWIFLLAVLSVNGSLFAQNKKKIDSLEQQLKKEQPDTQKVKIYNQLSNHYRYSDPDKQIEYARRGLSLAKENNYQSGLSDAYNMLGQAYENSGRYNAAEQYYDSSLTACEKAGNKSGQARMVLNIANVRVKQADYPGAIDYTLKSLRLQESMHDTFGVAVCKFTLGNIYYSQKNTKGALRQYLEAWQINKVSVRNPEFEGVALSNIGGMFSELEQYDSSLYYYRIALNNFYAHDMQSRVGSNLNNIGSIWLHKGNIDSALYYHRLALAAHEKMENVQGIVSVLGSLGNDYSDKKNPDSALYYYNAALKIARSVGLRDKELNLYYELSKTYKSMKNYEKALEYSERYIGLNDSLHGDEQNASIERLKKNYELDQKDQEIRISEAQTKASDERNRRNVILFTATGVIAILIIVIILLMFRTKQKHNRELAKKNAEISQQKEEITASISYAKKIQEAILPLKEEISRSLPDSFIIWIPRDIVSGDFYWFARRGEKVFIACVDCTGHGVPGAFMSMIGNTLLNEIVLEKEVSEPNDVLDMLHARIRIVLKQENQHAEMHQRGMQDGMDIAFCAINTSSRELSYAGANRPAYIISNGVLTEAAPDKQPIGGSETDLHKPFAVRNFSLNSGDTVYLFSDGYPDQFGGDKGKKFMSRRFQELLLSVQGKDMGEQQQLLTDHFNNWKSGHEQVDDVLVIGFRL